MDKIKNNAFNLDEFLGLNIDSIVLDDIYANPYLESSATLSKKEVTEMRSSQNLLISLLLKNKKLKELFKSFFKSASASLKNKDSLDGDKKVEDPNLQQSQFETIKALIQEIAKVIKVNISNVKFYEDNSPTNGSYSPVEKDLYINTARLSNNPEESALFLHTILHELRHAYQDQVLTTDKALKNSKNNSFNAKLEYAQTHYTSLSDVEYNFSSDRMLYHTNITEIDAESFAYSAVEEILDSILKEPQNDPEMTFALYKFKDELQISSEEQQGFDEENQMMLEIILENAERIKKINSAILQSSLLADGTKKMDENSEDFKKYLEKINTYEFMCTANIKSVFDDEYSKITKLEDAIKKCTLHVAQKEKEIQSKTAETEAEKFKIEIDKEDLENLKSKIELGEKKLATAKSRVANKENEIYVKSLLSAFSELSLDELLKTYEINPFLQKLIQTAHDMGHGLPHNLRMLNSLIKKSKIEKFTLSFDEKRNLCMKSIIKDVMRIISAGSERYGNIFSKLLSNSLNDLNVALNDLNISKEEFASLFKEATKGKEINIADDVVDDKGNFKKTFRTSELLEHLGVADILNLQLAKNENTNTQSIDLQS